MNFARKLKPHHLRLIVKISQSGKLQFAAEALGMSQPAASRTLAEIETDVGFQLFERTAKGMTPTAIGTTFVRHAQSILTSFDNMEAEVEGISEGQLGEVKVGSVTGPAIRCLVPALLKIKAETPDIEANFEVGPSTELIQRLEQGIYDFVIARIPSHYDSRAFNILPARSEIVSLVVRSSHPLAHKAKVSLQDLSDYEWTVQERGSPIRSAVESAFATEEIRMPSHITNTSSLLVMLGLLEHSDTVATLVDEVASLLTRGETNANLSILKLDRQILVPPYFIIMDRGRQLSRAAERLLEEVLTRI